MVVVQREGWVGMGINSMERNTRKGRIKGNTHLPVSKQGSHRFDSVDHETVPIVQNSAKWHWARLLPASSNTSSRSQSIQSSSSSHSTTSVLASLCKCSFESPLKQLACCGNESGGGNECKVCGRKWKLGGGEKKGYVDRIVVQLVFEYVAGGEQRGTGISFPRFPFHTNCSSFASAPFSWPPKRCRSIQETCWNKCPGSTGCSWKQLGGANANCAGAIGANGTNGACGSA